MLLLPSRGGWKFFEVSDEEYQRRLAEVEAYFDRRVWRYGGRGDIYLPDAKYIVSYVCSCVDADYLQVSRPAPRMTATLQRVAEAALAEFDSRWKEA